MQNYVERGNIMKLMTKCVLCNTSGRFKAFSFLAIYKSKKKGVFIH